MSAWEPGSVRSFQAIIYTAYAGAGSQALITGAPPGAVARAMGEHTAMAWAILLIAGPLLTGIGVWRENAPAGLWLQLAGDTGLAAGGAAYSYAVIAATWGGTATYAAWVAGALAVCSARVAIGTARRLRAVTAAMHDIDRGR